MYIRHQEYKEESILFCLVSVLYAWLSISIFSTGILMPHDGLIGGYLGYDNYYRFETSGGVFDISHPFFNLFYAINRIGLVSIFGERSALYICIAVMTLCSAGGITATYAYLRRVLSLSILESIIPTLLLAGSFTALTLPFTIESYPISFFFLPLSILSLSIYYKRNGEFSLKRIWLFAFILGGITLTNVAKPSLAILLQKDRLSHKIKKGLSLGAVFSLSVLLIGLLFVYRAHQQNTPENDPRKLAVEMFEFQKKGNEPVAEYFGHPLLISELSESEQNNELTLRPTPYKSKWSYIFPIFFLLTAISAPLLNHREKLVWLPIFYLLVDIAVNIIGGYGMNEAIIFGGHWVFLLPILLGWIFKASRPKVRMALCAIVLALTGIEIIHNLSVILLRLHL